MRAVYAIWRVGANAVGADCGEPRHVLLSIEAYRQLTGGRRSIVDALGMPGDEIEAFEAPRANIVGRPVDLG